MAQRKSLSGLHILVVDDRKIDIGMLKTAVCFIKGATMDAAMSGSEAIAKAKQQSPDIIVMDHRLTEEHGEDMIDGIQAAWMIKHQAKKEVPVIMVSAEIDTPLFERWKQEGVIAAYMRKGEAPKKLEEVIRKILLE